MRNVLCTVLLPIFFTATREKIAVRAPAGARRGEIVAAMHDPR